METDTWKMKNDQCNMDMNMNMNMNMTNVKMTMNMNMPVKHDKRQLSWKWLRKLTIKDEQRKIEKISTVQKDLDMQVSYIC